MWCSLLASWKEKRLERPTNVALQTHCPLRQVVGILGIGLELCADLKNMLLLYCLLCFDTSVSHVFEKKYLALLVPGRPRWAPWAALVLVSQLCWAAPDLREPRLGLSRSTMWNWVYGKTDKGGYPKKTHFPFSLCSFPSRHQELLVAVQRCFLKRKLSSMAGLFK